MVKHRTYVAKEAFPWHFPIYERQLESQAVVVVVGFLYEKNAIKNPFKIDFFLAYFGRQLKLPGTLTLMGRSPRSKALILFSICRSGAGFPCDSLSGSSSSSIGGAKSRRGVDTISTTFKNE